MADWPLPYAVRALRQGLSARAGLSAFRAAGGHVADRTWYRLYSEAKASVADRVNELGRPLNRRPTASERTMFSTRGARGVLQQIEVFVRDKATGQVEVLPYSVTSRGGVTRQEAIDEALSVIGDRADGYGQVVLGALHVAAYQMVPS